MRMAEKILFYLHMVCTMRTYFRRGPRRRGRRSKVLHFLHICK